MIYKCLSNEEYMTNTRSLFLDQLIFTPKKLPNKCHLVINPAPFPMTDPDSLHLAMLRDPHILPKYTMT